MAQKKPSNRFAPAVIAGVTIGFLIAGYKLVFTKPKDAPSQQPQAKDDQESK